MKILLVHNDYGAYSGEEAVVDKMAEMLSQAGHSVAQLRMSTAGLRDSIIGKCKAFICGLYSPQGVRAMRDAIKREKPDVINIHNLFPFIGPAALRECQRSGIPVVMTVHNYRLICPTGLFMRRGKTCEICLETGNEWACIRHNCENSLLKSVAYAARNAIARSRRHFIDCVDRFVCITTFQRDKLLRAGFPLAKLSVIPNSMDAPDSFVPTEGKYVAYCGRISDEKGIDLILEAARANPDIPFRLAGKVADTHLIDSLPPNVTLTGYLSGEKLLDFYRNAKFFVMASKCYEGFPMTILEAARFGKPMIAPAHGAFPEILGPDISPLSASPSSDPALAIPGQTSGTSSGLLFSPSDSGSLSVAIRKLWSDPSLIAALGQNAFQKLHDRYSSRAVSTQWLDLLSNITSDTSPRP